MYFVWFAEIRNYYFLMYIDVYPNLRSGCRHSQFGFCSESAVVLVVVVVSVVVLVVVVWVSSFWLLLQLECLCLGCFCSHDVVVLVVVVIWVSSSWLLLQSRYLCLDCCCSWSVIVLIVVIVGLHLWIEIMTYSEYTGYCCRKCTTATWV